MDTIAPDLIRDDKSAHTTGRMSGRNPIEVLVRADRRRSWTAEQKREIVIESLEPEQTAADIARKHGITTGQLYIYRWQMVTLRTDASHHMPRFASVAYSEDVSHRFRSKPAGDSDDPSRVTVRVASG